MKVVASLLLSLSALLSTSTSAQNSEVVSQAQAAASAWLALVDAGNYSGSWEQASGLFKSAIGQPSWASSCSSGTRSAGRAEVARDQVGHLHAYAAWRSRWRVRRCHIRQSFSKQS